MKAWGKIKSIDNLSDRLDRLEGGLIHVNAAADYPYATTEELEQMTSTERHVAWFNWHVREIMPYYKAEVMRLHNITSDEEYDRSTFRR